MPVFCVFGWHPVRAQRVGAGVIVPPKLLRQRGFTGNLAHPADRLLWTERAVRRVRDRVAGGARVLAVARRLELPAVLGRRGGGQPGGALGVAVLGSVFFGLLPSGFPRAAQVTLYVEIGVYALAALLATALPAARSVGQ